MPSGPPHPLWSLFLVASCGCDFWSRPLLCGCGRRSSSSASVVLVFGRASFLNMLVEHLAFGCGRRSCSSTSVVLVFGRASFLDHVGGAIGNIRGWKNGPWGETERGMGSCSSTSVVLVFGRASFREHVGGAIGNIRGWENGPWGETERGMGSSVTDQFAYCILMRPPKLLLFKSNKYGKTREERLLCGHPNFFAATQTTTFQV